MSGDFTGDDLNRIVELGGQALELEDRFICGCLSRNPVYSGSKQAFGITYLKDERYYQRLILRALLPSFPYMVKPEYRDGHFDIALLDSSGEGPAALGELKLWMDPAFGAVPDIVRDIEKLAKETCAQFVLVFTSAKKGELDGCVEELLKRLQCSEKKQYLYRFDSEYDKDGKGTIEHNGEFALIGVLLKESVG